MTLDRTQSPAFNSIKDFKLVQPRKTQLQNGAPLFSLNMGTQPICNLQILFHAGRKYETSRSAASFTAKMLFEGNEKLSATAINQIFDEVGAYWEINAGTDYLTIDIHVMTKHLSTVLETVYGCLSTPSFPKSEYEQLKSRTIQQLRVNLEKTSYLAAVNFRQKVFGIEHPYGYSLTLETLQKGQLEDVVTFYDQNIKDSPFSVILSGQVSDAEISLIDNWLGSLHILPKKASVGKELTLQTPVKAYIEKEEASQTSIRLGKSTFLKKHPDAIKFEVLNEILGGYFGSRLMKNIREQKGFTYGIYSSLIYFQDMGYFVIGSDVIKEKRAEALEEINKEIGILTKEPVRKDELETVKNYMAGNFVKSISSSLAASEYFKTIYFNQLPADYYDNYISKINQVTSEELLEMATKYLTSGLIEVSVG